MKVLFAILFLIISFAVVVLLVLFFKSQIPKTGITNITNWSWI